MSRSEKLLIFVLACIQFTHMMDFMIMMPLSDIIMESFSLNPLQFSWVVSSYTFGAGASSLVAAFYIDRFDRKKALWFIYMGFILGNVACALSTNYIMLLAARSISGLFGGVMGALILAIIGDSIHQNRRSTAMGYVMGAFSIASVFGVPFGLFIAAKFQNWQMPFWFLSAISLVVLWGINKYIPSLSGHVEKARQNKRYQVFLNIRNDPNQQRALLFSVMLMLGQFTIIPYLARYMVRNVGFEQSQLSLIYLVGGALTIFSSPFFGKLADKKGKLLIYTIFGIINLVPILTITHLGQVPIWMALCVTGLFFVTANARFVPAQSLITSVVEPAERGGFMSVNSSVQSITNGIAPLIAGLLVVETGPAKTMVGYNYAGYVAVVASLIAVYLAQKIKANY
ncbi:MAG TPA: MFS transporter [Luteibaculaceae bacterium]|nr:MFS transporter [Luteibaculaceae bacterium]